MEAAHVPTTLWDLCGSVRDRDCLTFPRRKPRREARETHLGWQEAEASLKCVMCLSSLVRTRDICVGCELEGGLGSQEEGKSVSTELHCGISVGPAPTVGE